MKTGLIQSAIKKISLSLILIPGLLIAVMLPALLFAQADSAKTNEATTEEPSLIAPSLEFVSVQKSDKTIDLKATLKAKIKGTFYKMPLLKVRFVLIQDGVEKELGFKITDPSGTAVLTLKADGLTTDQEGKLHFKAVFAGNKQIEATEEEKTIKRGRLEIVPVKEDSLLTVKVKLIDPGTAGDSTVKDAVIGVFVKRMFAPLKIGEGTTDEAGETSVEIAANLPGDSKGNITLLAKLDENETYGNLESVVVQQWGIPVSDQIENQPRTLWSSDPPVWMLVTFFILMSVVWGHYIVIVIQLFRLRKEEPHESTVTTVS